MDLETTIPQKSRQEPTGNGLRKRDCYPSPQWIERILGLGGYLAAAATLNDISVEMAALARKVWLSLYQKVPALTVPYVSIGPDGQVCYTWDEGEHYLTLDIAPDGSLEMFYRNRSTDESWIYPPEGTETFPKVEEALPEVVSRLRFLEDLPVLFSAT